jgi:hypothetical protein
MKNRAPNSKLGETVLEVVENQLRENNPPEVRLTLKRLMDEGQSREQAVKLIGAAFIILTSDMLKAHQPYDAGKYVAMLGALPQLPGD